MVKVADTKDQADKKSKNKTTTIKKSKTVEKQEAL